jgi:excisionase family DNA binding protein
MVLDKVIGVEEAAKLLALSPGYIKNLCAAGKIESKKIGKTWVIDKSSLKPSKNRKDEIK